jgi:gliding motility-associated-like protein
MVAGAGIEFDKELMKRKITLLLFLFCHLHGAMAQEATLSGVVNQYTRVKAVLNSCQIRVDHPGFYSVGEQVLLIQMKGAVIDKTNTPGFGALLSLNRAGLFEFNYIDSVNGDTVTLAYQLKSANYDVNARMQMVSVPTYDVIRTNGLVYPRSWDGITGGIVVMEARDSLVLNNSIYADSAGFRGGLRSGANYTCNMMDYSYSEYGTPYHGGYKGESFVLRDAQHISGRGPYATGGGGGNNHNTGGGGGGNFSTGGLGGKQSYVNSGIQGCNDTLTENGGIGGRSFAYGAFNDRVFPGGGGGGGHQNDLPSNGGGEGGMGGHGGGIVIIVSPLIHSNNSTISANGGNVDTISGRDGAGGGGGGGSILLYSNRVSGQLFLETKGGQGGDNNSHTNLSFNLGGTHGTGGGGGGGYIGFGASSVPANVQMEQSGGRAGQVLNTASHNYNGTYGAVPGSGGGTLTSVALPRNSQMCMLSSIDARDDIDSVAKDGVVSVKVKKNDTYNRRVRVRLCRPPVNGTAVVEHFDSIRYTPAPGFSGKDSLLYCLCTVLSPEVCDSASVYIQVNTVKISAVSDFAQTYVNTPVLIPVLDNDTLNTPPSVSLRTAPLYGTAVWNGSSFEYVPAPGYIGTDSFAYRICSSSSPVVCDSAWVFVRVDRGVEANNDFVSTRTGVPVIIHPKSNDVLNLAVVISILKYPENGAVQIISGDSLRYTPQTGFFGSDTIKYKICSVNPAGVCDSAFIYIGVFPPLSAADDYVQTTSGRITGLRPVTNDTAVAPYILSIHSGPRHGNATVSGSDSIYYQSEPGFRGRDSIVYLLCSGAVPGLCDTAVIHIQISSPVEANDDRSSTLEDVAVDIAVKQNDMETEPTRLAGHTPPHHGSVTYTGSGARYTPLPDYHGTDSFRYFLCTQASPVICDSAWVFMDIIPVNDPPIAVFDTATTYRNRSRLIDVLLNDIEPDGDSLILHLLSQPQNGNVSMEGSSFLYRPARNYTGADRFRYVICDDASPSLCDSTDVFIEVLERKSLQIPNGISPNGDNVNDAWVIDGIDLIHENEVLILNRWGEVVWEAKNYDNSWTGLNKRGEPLPDGTYYYVIRSPYEEDVIKGFIVIQR